MSIARRTTAAALMALVAALGLVACTSGSGSASGAGDGVAHGAGTNAAGGVARAPRAGSAASSAPSSAPAGSASAGSVTLTSATRVVRAELTISIAHTASVATAADTATTIATTAGGTVDADERTGGAAPSAQLVLRVPPAALEVALTRLAALGSEKARRLSSQDVTTQVADVTSRVTSEGAAIARLRQLYTSASKVSDVITIENELATRESDLESLQAQQRALSAQTAMASITLTITRAGTPIGHDKARHRSGFLGGLHSGWDAFTRAASALAAAGGAALPFAVLLLVLATAVRLLWPRLRTGRRPSRRPVATGPTSE